MNESQPYTPSELIYLFLDGEADGVQQSTLFAALAHDAELQSEFQEAVLVSRTLDRVRNDVHPPQDFTEGVFAAAGFTTPQFHPVPTPLAGKWSASLAAIIRHAGIPMVSALIGALTVFLLMTFGHDESPVMSAQNVAEHRASAAGSSHGAEQSATEREVAPEQHSNSSSARTQYAVAKTHPMSETPVREQNKEQVASTDISEEPIIPQTPVNEVPFSDTPVEVVASEEPNITPAREVMPVVEQASIKTPVQQLERRNSYADLQPIYRWEKITSEREPGVTMFVRGIESINSFPSRKNNIEASGSTSNVGFGCLYYFSRNQALGMEVARELLPISSSGEDNPELNSVLLWIGGLWQVQTDFPGLRSDIQPFLRLGLGGTAYGPSGKALAGIMYTAEQRLSISLGIETTALLSWQNGRIGSTEKIAFSYGLSFHF